MSQEQMLKAQILIGSNITRMIILRSSVMRANVVGTSFATKVLSGRLSFGLMPL
jgi:hypothetical protein